MHEYSEMVEPCVSVLGTYGSAPPPYIYVIM